MSKYPRYGPPPPYTTHPVQQSSYPPYQAPTVSYVPTPVYVPVGSHHTYPPQPPQPTPPNATYVTNIYQQPTPEPVVQYVEVSDEVDWVQTTTDTFLQFKTRALPVYRGSQYYIIRARHGGEFIPGKLVGINRSAYVTHTGNEVRVHNFELLCAKPDSVRWLTASNGDVPPGAIPGGNSHNAEPLYIARVKRMGTYIPGKVHPSHNCAYISYEGREIRHESYEVLCKALLRK